MTTDRELYERRPLFEVTKELVAVAQGLEKADLVLRNVRLLNVNTAEIQEGLDVAVRAGRIAYVGRADHTIGPDTIVVDGEGKVLVPGFLDGHIHVESSMVTVREYARVVVPHGTTGIFMDPHEIANVLGMEGVRFMVDDGRDVPLNVWATMPSCVPAVPGFEDGGAQFGPAEVTEAMSWEGIAGLGELMNFPGVLMGSDHAHGEIEATLRAGKPVTGHYSMPDIDRGLNAYIASGVSSCHESTRKEDALARMRLGMYAMMREGSAWHDVKETVRSLTEEKIDARFGLLVSDDAHPDTLLSLGHMDHIVRRAIEEGLDPIRAVQMVTINTAQCFGMAHEIGSISPGKFADMVLLSDLARVAVDRVFYNGRLVAEKGEMAVAIAPSVVPGWARETVRLARPLSEADMKIDAPEGASSVRVRVMEIIEAHVGTYSRQMELPVVDGAVPASVERDVAKMAVFERHRATGTRGLGFVTGFGLQGGAVASTVAHDAHNLMVVGTDDADMALAANVLAEEGGGMIAVRDGQVLALLPLPLAGLMSDEPARTVAASVEALDRAWKELGCSLHAPFMTMALLPLACLPELRLTNRGLVDTVAFRFTDLFV
ncbi:adenine deaminase [Aminirod propionatiphilus]|uniref:adenine deaminase n=1 Tax=Aminirod propionatiphilus TaxID=3415223 RepID=UPI003BFA6A0A